VNVSTPMTPHGTGVPAARTRARLLSPTSPLVLDGTRAPFAGAAHPSAAVVPAAQDVPFLQALVAAPPPRGAPV
jgi:hypothetical protein